MYLLWCLPSAIYFNSPWMCVGSIVDAGVFEPQHEISNNVVCATSKVSDQPAHRRSLIRAFASWLNIRVQLSY